ncbi:MAG: GTP-binding protein [Acholeplasmatales bacterium]|nr:GTP-binding protein [Acholeplasmatales bacterium]
MIKIDIISGFLGAGKTTLIKRLLSTKLTNEKVVLVENEYGEIGIDAGFLKDTKINITELNEGCICCSLQGDFEVALNKLAKDYNPDRIIIEPSGVGKLSDIVKAVTDAKVPDSKINALVCLCDVTKAKMYLRNFGEFYTDQISHAKTVILSRTDVASEEKVSETLEIIRSYNDHALIVTTPVSTLEDEQLLAAFEASDDDFEAKLLEEVKSMKSHHHHHHHHHDDDDEECECYHHHHDDDDEECECHHHHHDDDDEECECHHHHHDDDDEECECHHHHHDDDDEECDDPNCSCHHHHHEGELDADDVFTSFGFDTAKVFDEETLKASLHTLSETEEFGTILRVKGYVNAGSNWLEFDLVPGQVDVRHTSPFACGKICIIGSNIKKKDIKDLLLK